MLIRSATISDCPAISAIYNHYVLHDTCTYQEEPEQLEDREKWFAAHGPQHPVIVAEEAGQVVGWASLSPYNPRSAYRYTVENSIYLKPDRRRLGIGKLLLQDLIDRAKALGHRTIIAGISSEQVGSLKIHENFGFIKVGHLKRVGYKASQWLDVVYLQLELKTELRSIPEAEFTP
jgi:phosphinothricin acetyltransferase